MEFKKRCLLNNLFDYLFCRCAVVMKTVTPNEWTFYYEYDCSASYDHIACSVSSYWKPVISKVERWNYKSHIILRFLIYVMFTVNFVKKKKR